MSDIPVGSPSAPPGRHAAPGGWYPDPLDVDRERYWDGWQWSRNTRDSEVPPAYRQAPAAAVPPPGPYGRGPAVPYARGPVPGLSRQAATTADGVPLTGWWWRALAGLIDGLVLGLVTGLATLPFYSAILDAFSVFWDSTLQAAQTGAPPPQTPNFAGLMSGTDQLLVMVVTLALGLAYNLPFLRVRGATLGMLACGLRVVPLDEGRSTARLSWSSVVVRSLLWVLPWTLSLGILSVVDALLPDRPPLTPLRTRVPRPE